MGTSLEVEVAVAAIEGKMGKESKENKSETNALKEVSYCPGTVHTVIEDGFEQSKEDKRQKKYKKKTEISTVAEFDGSRNEHMDKKFYEKADDGNRQIEKKKEKKRKLELLEDNCKSDKEIYMVGEDLRSDNEVRARKEKKRQKEGSMKDQNESLSFQVESLKDNERNKNEEVKEQRSSQNDSIAQIKDGTEQIEKNKSSKGRRDKEVGVFKGKKKSKAVEQVGKVGENYDVDVSEKVEKKRKKRKKEGKEDMGGGVREMMAEGKKKNVAAEKVGKVGEDYNVDVSERVEKKRKKGKKEGKDDLGGGVREMMAEELGVESTMIEDKDLGGNKDKAHSIRKKTKEMVTKNGNKGNRKKPKSVETCPEDPKPKVKSKKVRFSGDVEVFPSSDGPSKGKEQNQEEGLVQGKRFTPEEDVRIKEAVFNYIRAHNLDEVEGLHMVLHCRSFPQIKNCWKEIGTAFRNRPYTAIYYRAHSLFERDETRTWTNEDIEKIKEYHEKHGPKWKELADLLNKNRVHLKDTWRRIKLPNLKKGHWSQDEYQGLFDLVNTDLQLRAFEEKKSKYGMLRDNISWTAICDKLSTRTDADCCTKWYNQLTSPMVAEGIWADTDDFRMLDALFSLDESCIEDVDWDNLLEHRSGDICRRRWNQMVSHIGEHGIKSFAEQVDVLSKRYCPDLIEAREAWDSKPVVD